MDEISHIHSSGIAEFFCPENSLLTKGYMVVEIDLRKTTRGKLKC
jgi:hypothetical protein